MIEDYAEHAARQAKLREELRELLDQGFTDRERQLLVFAVRRYVKHKLVPDQRRYERKAHGLAVTIDREIDEYTELMEKLGDKL